jgi:hypothetical protein
VSKATRSVIILLAVTFGDVAHAVDLQPGQWEISTQRERAGVVTERPKRTACFTPDQAKKIATQLGKAIPPEPYVSRGTTCKIIDWKTPGDEVTWRMQCAGLFPGEQTGRFVIDSPEHYSFTVRSTVSVTRGGFSRTFSSTLTTDARRVGECPK